MKRISIIVAILLLVLIAIPVVYFATVDLNDFNDPLLNASRDGDTEAIGRLIAGGGNPNKTDGFGNTPLSIAAHFGQTDAAELLLNNGARIDGISGEDPPLFCAAYSGHCETAAFLLRQGADPNLADRYGTMPLAVAAGKGDADLVTLLLDSGANIEQPDKRGWRPLHIALRSTSPSSPDRFATVTVLLERGADPNANNAGGSEEDSRHDSHMGFRKTLPNRGDTPIEIARSNGFVEIVELLKTHGGN